MFMSSAERQGENQRRKGERSKNQGAKDPRTAKVLVLNCLYPKVLIKAELKAEVKKRLNTVWTSFAKVVISVHGSC